MYLKHYNLKIKPFSLSPGPDFLWLGEKHQEALATLNYGIFENLGFLLLTGEVGAGKTALIYRLINSLDPSIIVAHITDPGLGTLDFFKLVAVEFNLPDHINSKADFLIELERFLHKVHAQNKRVLLIVDEAQRLNNKLLDQIRVLSNIELSDQKLINIFFIGQPEFKNMLMDSQNRAIRQRIAINYHIEPLTEAETGHYIEHRMEKAGASRRIFKPGAIREVFRYTHGYPRAINIICDHALLTGFASGSKSIDAGVIKECEKELNIQASVNVRQSDFPRPSRGIQPKRAARSIQLKGPTAAPARSASWRNPVLIGMVVVLMTTVSIYLLWYAPRWMSKPMAPSSPAESSDLQAYQILKDQEQPDPPEPKQSTPNRKLDKAPSRPSAPDKAAPAPSSIANGVPQKAPPTEEIKTADRQTAIFIARANPAPAKLPLPATVESDVTEPDHLQNETSLPAAPSDAQAPSPTAAAPQATLEKQDSAVAREDPSVADVKQGVLAALQRASIAANQPAPAKEQPSDREPVESDDAVTGPAVPPAPKPEVPPKTPSTENMTIPGASAALTTSEPASAKEPAQSQTSPRQRTPSQPSSSSQGPESTGSPRTGTQSRLFTEPLAAIEPSVKKSESNTLKTRLLSFLQAYCRSYAAKDLDAFSNFFTPNAIENGKSFESLLPKYQRNFNYIESIQYRIELQQFSFDDSEEIVKIDGEFYLKWLPSDKKWRENSGKIFMSLKEDGPSFKIQRLDYYGGSTR